MSTADDATLSLFDAIVPARFKSMREKEVRAAQAEIDRWRKQRAAERERVDA